MREFADAVIVGGGPAGSALGILLARAGRSVTILEKSDAAHDKVCGDFLSYEAIYYLQSLGIDPVGLGATPISKVRLASRELIGGCPLPFTGMALTRRVLDESLLANAERAGARVLRGRRVEELCMAGGGWSARLADGEEIRAGSAFLATGKSDLHGWPRASGKQNDLVAFKMYFRLRSESREALANNVELILFPGGYAGLLPLKQGVMNLCMLVRRSALRVHEGRWSNIVQHLQLSSPYLARYLQGATALSEKPLALSSIPYGYVQTASLEGLWRLGDQAAVIPSFSGDGISIALHSAHVAAAEYLRGESADAFQRKLCLQVRPAVRAATILSRLMVAAPALAQGVRLRPAILAAITRGTRIPETELLAAG